MANTFKNNLINIDSNTPHSFSTGVILHINYIIVISSADNPVLILNNKHGDTFFQVEDATANARYYGGNLNGQRVEGLVVNTFTNIKKVIIGLKKVGD